MKIRLHDSHLNGEIEDYLVELVVERGNDVVSVHKRLLEGFPRNSLNSVALLKSALNLFDAEALGLEDDYDSDPPSPEDLPGALAWRQQRTLRTIQGGES